MNDPSFPANSYQDRLQLLQQQLQRARQKKSLISWGRLAAIVLLIADVYYLYPAHLAPLIIAGIVLVILFIRLIMMASDTSTIIANLEQLVNINQQELQVAAGAFQQLPDGAAYSTSTHAYANDLDLFGRASVFQYLNRTQSQQGNSIFAGWLMAPSSLETIISRQEAVKELAPQLAWRQQLQAYGATQPITLATEKKVAAWLEQPNRFSNKAGWRLLRIGYPVIAIALVILYAVDILPPAAFTAAYIAGFALSGFIKKLTFPEYSSLDKVVPEVDVLFNSARWIETNLFASPYFLKLQQAFLSNDTSSSLAIRQLKNILDKFDAGLNIVLLMILNPLLLWDLQLVFRLEKWRLIHRTKVLHWFIALGETEALCSLSNAHFNHPGWVFPVFDSSQHGLFKASRLGHPLISANKMVYNNFSTEGTPKVALITGSNMAGKSTFLRSTAVNIVLAMMGSPVCATEMKLSPMRVISSMRIADNLEESTSTFYAELKKLKSIIDSVNSHEKVFVLLDEILRGTNSLDRHTGSKALVKQLIARNAVAMLATHDVELAQMKNEFPASIENYHFDAQIEGEELYFDYKLKDGICKSINASILMKKIGIEL